MKETIAVLFGGQSSEHVVSCMSAANVIEQIDRERYEILLVGITEEGRWLLADSLEQVCQGTWKESKVRAVISPDATDKSLLVFREDNRVEKVPVHVAFPVLHGLFGEDGTVQGLLELAGIPYVGCGVLSSAAAMDKLTAKVIVNSLGIRQAVYVPVMRRELEQMEAVVERVEKALPYPVFVKPSNAGSSRGVNRAENRGELEAALREAALHDRRILVEEAIAGHEVETAVLGGGTMEVSVSGVGEILAAAEFYDFESKYYNEESRTIVDPPLPQDATERVRRTAVRIFKAMDGYGLSRVDFFVTDQGEVVFNEINTMPGFTGISMYPMLWEARGISKKELVQKLIDCAKERYHG
ncbi:MAG: D-alanine--D-alanine ligase [Hungatella sp.]|nr:D-alanine--D-alanine ligase [Hungatella sp.]